MKRIKGEVQSFFDCVAVSSEKAYLILLGLYILSFLIRRIGWELQVLEIATNIRFGLLALVIWGCALYLIVLIAEWKQLWKKTFPLILVGCLALMIAGMFSRCMTIESYAAVMGAFFSIVAYRKKWPTILKMMLMILLGTLVIAWLGTTVGITADVAKANRAFGGHSFGIIYPNTWGFLMTSLLMLFWYLYLKNRPIVSFLLFEGIALFMWFVVTCRTSALLCAAFPVLAISADYFQEKRAEEVSRGWKLLVIGMPFIVFGFTMMLCWRMDWVRDTFYKTPFYSMAMRFVEGGYSLRRNGISLFGHPFYDFDAEIVDASYQITQIMDNAYVSNLILRGILNMAICLSWIAFSHWQCIKRRDYRLIAVSFLFLILAMMERPALDVWFNYVLLYPLSKGFEKNTQGAKSTGDG